MLTPRANIHHSKIPAPGSIVTVRVHRLQPGRRYRRYRVVAYPLSDAADQRYSRGIHTVYLDSLDGRERAVKVAGHWCEEED